MRTLYQKEALQRKLLYNEVSPMYISVRVTISVSYPNDDTFTSVYMYMWLCIMYFVLLVRYQRVGRLSM